MMKFSTAVLRMAKLRRNNMKAYYSSLDGDEHIKDLELSRNRFIQIYTNLSLYSPSESKVSGESDKKQQGKVQRYAQSGAYMEEGDEAVSALPQPKEGTGSR